MNYNFTISERQDRGEVITPESLVEEMLDKLPQEVFKSETTTFLDPCFGTGSFLKGVVLRLSANGHSTENINSRVFGFEINNKMFNETKRKFRGINIVKQDFLNTDINMKFDVIIGNPPYQSSDERRDGAIWPEFVKKGIMYLNEGGYLSFLTPSSWAADSSDKTLSFESTATVAGLKNLMLKYLDLTHVSFGETVNKHFNVGADISLFIGIKNKSNRLTEILTDSGISRINLRDYDFIPFNLNQNIISILEKTIFSKNYFEVLYGTYKLRVKNTSTTSTTYSDEFKWKFANTSAKYSKGIYGYSNYKTEYHDKPKVVWSNSGYNKPFSDVGDIGLGDHTRAIPLDVNEHDSLIWYLENSKLIKFLSSMKNVGGYVIGYSVISECLPKIKLRKEMEDNYVYSQFNLTQEEIDYIENAVK